MYSFIQKNYLVFAFCLALLVVACAEDKQKDTSTDLEKLQNQISNQEKKQTEYEDHTKELQKKIDAAEKEIEKLKSDLEAEVKQSSEKGKVIDSAKKKSKEFKKINKK